jgi:uncharacterized membrane protein YkoI
MKRKIFLALGMLLATAIVSGGSIVLYERFGPHEHRHATTTDSIRGSTPGISPGRGMSEGVHDGSLLPLAQALDIAARHLPGEVLKIELENKHGRSIYEIKVLAANGRVREVKLDARSGEVIEIEDD